MKNIITKNQILLFVFNILCLSVNLQAREIHVNRPHPLQLGMGYNSVSDKYTFATCINGQQKPLGHSERYIYQEEADFKTLAQASSGARSSDAKVFFVTASSSTRYGTEHAQSDTRMNWFFGFNSAATQSFDMATIK